MKASHARENISFQDPSENIFEPIMTPEEGEEESKCLYPIQTPRRITRSISKKSTDKMIDESETADNATKMVKRRISRGNGQVMWIENEISSEKKFLVDKIAC